MNKNRKSYNKEIKFIFLASADNLFHKRQHLLQEKKSSIF